MPDSSASAAGLRWAAAYSTRPSPTSCSTVTPRPPRRAPPGRPSRRGQRCPHQVPSSSLTISSASSGLRTASSSRAARSISANSALGGAAAPCRWPRSEPPCLPGGTAPPPLPPAASGPDLPDGESSPPGWLRRLCGLTLIASQIGTCGGYATVSSPPPFRVPGGGRRPDRVTWAAGAFAVRESGHLGAPAAGLWHAGVVRWGQLGWLRNRAPGRSRLWQPPARQAGARREHGHVRAQAT
jgi:hypothetical protein